MLNQIWNNHQNITKYADVLSYNQKIVITTKNNNIYEYHKLSEKTKDWDLTLNGIRQMDPNTPTEPVKHKIEIIDDVLINLFNENDPPIEVVIN
jgi:hypothetical protein